MYRLRAQYFFAFAVIGCLVPFIPTYMVELDFTKAETGYLLSIASFAGIVTPWIIAALADSGIDARRIMAALFGIGACMLGIHYALDTYWPVVGVYLLFSLATAPIVPLQDGMNFSLQEDRKRSDLPTVSYQKIRIWGSIGFIIPSTILFFVFQQGLSRRNVLLLAAAFCVVGIAVALSLPEACGRAKRKPRLLVEPIDETAGSPRRGPRNWRDMPTLAAARTMLQPNIFVFCLGMLFVQLSVTAYYGYYPAYLEQVVGIEPKWTGLIVNFGVVVEIFFILGFGAFERWFGLRMVIALGALGIGLRMLLLWQFPTAEVAIASQVLHGPMVVVMHVAPAIYLNRCATDANRTSMQGLFAVTINGAGRIVGYTLAGLIAEHLQTGAFLYGAVLAGAATVLFIVAFRDHATVQTEQ
jgi:PPP family 3-phenylpropionic acid transporter